MKLHHLFQAVASRHGERVALEVGEQAFSYSQLHQLATAVANAITEDVGRGGQVAILTNRKAASIIGLLSTLYSDNAYVPASSANPVTRSASIVTSAKASLVIADEGDLAQVERLVDELPVRPAILALDAHGRLTRRVAGDMRAKDVVVDGHPAYIMFTSGSTGKPKGVPVQHGNVLHFVDFNRRRYGFDENDVFAQMSDLTFDLSVFDLFVAWSNGARVCIPRPMQVVSPYKYVADSGISVWLSVPSVINLLRKTGTLRPGSLPSLRHSFFCGEALTVDAAEAWAKAAPNSVVENLYGPTELTVACAAFRYDARTRHLAENGVVPIGTIYDGLDWVILGDSGKAAAVGEAGELCVAGPQKFPGYWFEPEKSREAHVLHATTDGTIRAYYRTGDRVKQLPSGDLHFIGRIDHQVKVSGFRVELGELEAAIRRHAGVIDAAAIGWPIVEETFTGLVAFVTGDGIDTTELLARLRGELPAYMLPNDIRVVDRLPLNGNGKVDRAALRSSLLPITQTS